MRNQMLDWLADERRATLMHKESGKTYIESRQDAEPILEFVKIRAEMPDDKDFKYLGEIPKATINQAIIEGWVDDPKAWKRWLEKHPKFSAKWHRGAN